MIKLELLFTVVVFAVWIFTLADVVQSPGQHVRTLPKVAWVVLVLLFPVLGSAAWFVFGRPPAASRPGKGERSVPQYPEYAGHVVRARSGRRGGSSRRRP